MREFFGSFEFTSHEIERSGTHSRNRPGTVLASADLCERLLFVQSCLPKGFVRTLPFTLLGQNIGSGRKFLALAVML